ncbi:MAG: SDR family oxidoreductase, partial [Pseudomonadales bacterium]
MTEQVQKTAVITGGGSGIGYAISLHLARKNIKVMVLDIDGSAAAATVADIEAEGGAAEAYIADVSSGQQMHDIFKKISSKHNIDILVNNAGIAHIGSIDAVQEEDLDRLYNINVKGTFNGMAAAVPVMKAQGQGVIINMASIAATVGLSDRFAYSMTKGAVVAMTLSVAKDYINDGIRCNCISPGRVHTPFVDNFLEKNYPDNKEEMFETLSKSQPIGR